MIAKLSFRGFVLGFVMMMGGGGPAGRAEDLPDWNTRERKTVPDWSPISAADREVAEREAAARKMALQKAHEEKAKAEREAQTERDAQALAEAEAKRRELEKTRKETLTKLAEAEKSAKASVPATSTAAPAAKTATLPAAPQPPGNLAAPAPTVAATTPPEKKEAKPDAEPIPAVIGTENAVAAVSADPGPNQSGSKMRRARDLRSEEAGEEPRAPASPSPQMALKVPDTRPPKMKLMRHQVVSGDTLWGISRKYKTTVDELKTANGLKDDRLSIGQVLVIPLKTSSTEGHSPPSRPLISTTAPEVSRTGAGPLLPPQVIAMAAPVDSAAAPHVAPVESAAEPVSAPAPLPPAAAKPSPAVSQTHVAIIGPGPRVRQELEDESKDEAFASARLPFSIQLERSESGSTTTRSPQGETVVREARVAAPLPPPAGNSIVLYAGATSSRPPLIPAGRPTRVQENLRREAERIARLDIDYNQSWRPPGEKEAWRMDCSNTVRYLYKKAIGIDIPRTASSQYHELRQKGRAWVVPLDANKQPSMDYLANYLQPGDLLFWENTYKPVRTPPITHVTVFMGSDEKGRWIMFGSQSGAQEGFISDDHGGPDLYVFDPLSPSGGYTTGFLGLSEVTGRFVAHARPLPDSSL